MPLYDENGKIANVRDRNAIYQKDKEDKIKALEQQINELKGK